MNNINSQLSALAVFSELYDNKKDIFDVLWVFVRYAIYKNQKWRFKAEDVQSLLIQEYNFDKVPLAVIKTLLRNKKVKDYIQNNQDNYNVTPVFKQIEKDSNYEEEMIEQKKRFEQLFHALRLYITENGYKEQISDDELLMELRSYLLDNQQGELFEAFSSFVIDNQGNTSVINNMNQIREGYILYEGISWCDDLNELENWNQPLTIYFDMDIIFYLAGYSGEIYKTIADEMYGIIQELNANYAKKHKGKRCIFIKYFSDVQEQINTYFKYAEDIVVGKRTLDISEPAMRYITTECDSPSRVKIMREELDIMLGNKAILVESKSFYNVEQQVHNIEDLGIVEKYEKKEKRTKIEKYLRNINYICMLREGRTCRTFKTCECILVTRNRTCAMLDLDKDIFIKKQYSRVISPEVLTSKLWFLSNKGISTIKFPASLDILVQAKTVMAHQVNKNISSVYERVMREYKNNNYSADEVARIVSGLRNYSLLPEEVTIQSVAETTNLSEESVPDLIKKYEKQYEEELAKKDYYKHIESENDLLQQQIIQKQQRVEEEIAASEEKDEVISDLNRELNDQSRENEKLKEVIAELQGVEERRKQRRKNIAKIGRIVLAIIFLGLAILMTILDFHTASVVSTILCFATFIWSVFIDTPQKK